jgi:Zn ribbon nucleic-acid-binding protein
MLGVLPVQKANATHCWVGWPYNNKQKARGVRNYGQKLLGLVLHHGWLLHKQRAAGISMGAMQPLCHECRKYIAGALCAGMRCIDAMQCNATDNVNIAMDVHGGYM